MVNPISKQSLRSGFQWRPTKNIIGEPSLQRSTVIPALPVKPHNLCVRSNLNLQNSSLMVDSKPWLAPNMHAGSDILYNIFPTQTIVAKAFKII